MVYVKVSTIKNELGTTILVAACDKELIGQTFAEGKLKLTVSESFYKGELINIENLSEHLKKANMGNLVGETVIEKAIEIGIISKSSVIKIQGIPHAQFMYVS